jgi:formiminotetrahydrofolate cyclodeaminase
MAAALGEMMAGLTEGRQRFAAVDRKVKKMHEKLSGARGELQLLIHEDVEAYRSLLKAVHLPRETGTQKAFRADAVEKSIHGATETPLRTIRAVYAILECLKVLIEIGNPNARCDAAVGAHLAYASLQGARYNVLINIRSIKDRVLARRCRAEASDLQARGRKLLRGIDRLAKIR